MAGKKKNEGPKFLEMPLPQYTKGYSFSKNSFTGLNYRQTEDSGQLSDELNITTEEAPYLTPSRVWYKTIEYTEENGNSLCPVSMFIFDDVLIVIYTHARYGLLLDRISLSGREGLDNGGVTKYVGVIDENIKDTAVPRSVVMFNYFTDGENVVSGRFMKKLLVFPDKKVMAFDVKYADNNTQTDGEAYDDFRSYISALESSKPEEITQIRGSIWCFVRWQNSSNAYTYIDYYYFDETPGDEHWASLGKTGKSNTKNELGSFALADLEVDVKRFSQAKDADIYEPTTDKVADGDKTYYRQVITEGGSDGSTAEDSDKKGVTYEKAEIESGSSVSGYYEKLLGRPAADMDKCQYWYNTETKLFYTYTDRTNECGNVIGWQGSATAPVFPDIDYATVYLSRLFGVGGGKVYASGYNNYANWAFDAGDTHNDYSPWCSATGANTKAGGDFTGITCYQNHVIVFKNDFMHEIYNTKNPFSIQDVYAEGCIDNRTIQEVGGKLIFASADGIMVYTGSKPRLISYKLGIDCFDDSCCSGTDGRYYYLYYHKSGGEREHRIFVYDTYTEAWSEEACGHRILNFAHSPKYGMYYLAVTDEENGSGAVYRRSPSKYGDWSFETELITSITPSSSSAAPSTSVKHVQKVQIAADMAQDSVMKAYILYDDEEFDADTSQCIADVYDREGRVIVRVMPRMSAHYGFKLHFEGSGFVRIHNMEFHMNYGGELTK